MTQALSWFQVSSKPIYCNWVVLSTSSVAVVALLSGWFFTSLDSATSTTTATPAYLKVAVALLWQAVQLQLFKSCGKYKLDCLPEFYLLLQRMFYGQSNGLLFRRELAVLSYREWELPQLYPLRKKHFLNIGSNIVSPPLPLNRWDQNLQA